MSLFNGRLKFNLFEIVLSLNVHIPKSFPTESKQYRSYELANCFIFFFLCRSYSSYIMINKRIRWTVQNYEKHFDRLCHTLISLEGKYCTFSLYYIKKILTWPLWNNSKNCFNLSIEDDLFYILLSSYLQPSRLYDIL